MCDMESILEDELVVTVDFRTSLMFRGLPTEYNRAMFISMLNSEGFAGKFTLVYMPTDFKQGCSFGYAFACFDSNDAARVAKAHFEGYNKWVIVSSKECDVDWCSDVQGLDAHIQKYRNSPMMHHSVPEEHKPVIFQNGAMVAFPCPTRRIPKPRCR